MYEPILVVPVQDPMLITLRKLDPNYLSKNGAVGGGPLGGQFVLMFDNELARGFWAE